MRHTQCARAAPWGGCVLTAQTRIEVHGLPEQVKVERTQHATVQNFSTGIILKAVRPPQSTESPAPFLNQCPRNQFPQKIECFFRDSVDVDTLSTYTQRRMECYGHTVPDLTPHSAWKCVCDEHGVDTDCRCISWWQDWCSAVYC